MGVVQSILCSVTFCIERVLSWTCCAFMLMLLMFVLIILMVYGISVGYHYAQKELAAFAMSSRSTTEKPKGGNRRRMDGDAGVVRLVAVNETESYHAHPVLEVYNQSPKPPENIYMEDRNTPMVLLETERPPNKPELSQREQDLANKLIGRYRRSKHNATTAPFLRPLHARDVTHLSRFATG